MNRFIQGKRLPLSVSLALVLLSLSAGWVRADERLPDCYVLSAGVDNYPNANKLNGCLNDARNTTAAFEAQQGLLFGKVYAQTLLDAQATSSNILQRFKNFGQQGMPGDFVVLFVSGHGGRTNNDQTWFFLPYNFNPNNQAATTLSDRQLLDAADGLIQKGRKVVIIVDACFAGQLRTTAQSYFNKYRNPQGGGLILLLSSSATQESNALGQYSAFAKAFADAMTRAGDLNHDGKITLKEIRQYSYNRTYQLLRQSKMSAKQDSIVAWSPGISENMPLAATKKQPGLQIANSLPSNSSPENPSPVKPPFAKQQVSAWVGSENLGGFGNLSFSLYPGGKAIMEDAKESSEGTWQQNGKQITLTFYAGRVVYTGILRGANLSGTAHNERTAWTFSVQRQASQ